MSTVEAPPVDAAELAALERGADQGPQWKPHPPVLAVGETLCRACGLAAAAKVHIESMADDVTSRAGSIPAGSDQPKNPVGSRERGVAPPGPTSPLNDTTLTPVYRLGADGKTLVPLVEAAAVEARLERMERYLYHALALTIVLADRFGVTPQELDAGRAAIQGAETQHAKGKA